MYLKGTLLGRVGPQSAGGFNLQGERSSLVAAVRTKDSGIVAAMLRAEADPNSSERLASRLAESEVSMCFRTEADRVLPGVLGCGEENRGRGGRLAL
jgi:hypothetical protein